MRKRKAGEVFRNDDIDFDHTKQVGEGAFGTVYEGITPGRVVKTFKDINDDVDYLKYEFEAAANEAYLQQLAASRGLAPRVTGMGASSFSPGPLIEMEDMRDMYETVASRYGGRAPRSVRVKTQQQVGQMALMGIEAADRNPGNVMVNRFTGKPIQIDFGVAEAIGATRGDYKQVRTLKNATTDGLNAAGLVEEAEIYDGIVSELMEKGDLAGAFDVAKQGFSRLQKIDAAALKDEGSLNINASSPLEGEATKRRILQELADEGFFN